MKVFSWFGQWRTWGQLVRHVVRTVSHEILHDIIDEIINNIAIENIPQEFIEDLEKFPFF